MPLTAPPLQSTPAVCLPPAAVLATAAVIARSPQSSITCNMLIRSSQYSIVELRRVQSTTLQYCYYSSTTEMRTPADGAVHFRQHPVCTRRGGVHYCTHCTVSLVCHTSSAPAAHSDCSNSCSHSAVLTCCTNPPTRCTDPRTSHKATNPGHTACNVACATCATCHHHCLTMNQA